LIKKTLGGTSLVVQGLRLLTSSAGAQVQSPVRELTHMLQLRPGAVKYINILEKRDDVYLGKSEEGVIECIKFIHKSVEKYYDNGKRNPIRYIMNRVDDEE